MIKRPKFSNNPFAKGPRTVIIITLMFVTALVLLTSLAEYTRQVKSINYSTFLQAVERDQVKTAHVSGQEVTGKFKDGSWYETIAPAHTDFTSVLRAHDVEFGFEASSSQIGHWYFMLLMLGALVLFAMWYFFKQKNGSNNSGGIFSIGKSRAKVITGSKIKEDFSCVAGAKEAKLELQDVVDYLKDPDKFRRLGARVARGLLLVGEPGNGKTLLARAVAGEANCSFFSITGSDFIEVFVGVGAARVRDLFAQARKQAPSIIFIDEIDAIGRQRGSGIGGGHDEREQTLNQLLTEMDGFDEHTEPVIVMAATNMPEVLDKALLRPGRFDRSVVVPFPDEVARAEVLKIHARDFKLGSDVDFGKIAEKTAGFSGADLANLMNKAALVATKKNKDCINQEDLEQAHQELLSSDGSSSDRRNAAANAGSTASMFMPAQVKTKFTDVAGADEAKEELQDVVNFLKNPSHYRRLGAQIPRGVLLTGNPGNGKTLLARAIAGEANCPFFNVSGSSFIEQYIGTGAARVRELFAQARKHKPSIIFIDEIDAIGVRRSEGSGGDREYTQTLNQLLAEMDGFDVSESPIIVIGATNRPQVLDKALTRPGRFGLQIEVPYPTLKNREKILQVHMKGIKCDDTVDIERLAKGTTGFSGAQLAGLVNEAALLASKSPERTTVSMADFEEARDKIIMGKAMLSKIMSPEECKMTAYHEAGHALMYVLQPEHVNSLYKATIIPRGMSLGSTHGMPKGDVYSQSYDEMIAQIRVSLGGRVAERIIFNKLTTGARGDFETANEIAREIVMVYGMHNPNAPVIYGMDAYGRPAYSQRTAEKLDAAIEEILEKAQAEVTEQLTAHKDDLEKLAKALLERETLDNNEIYEVLGYDPATGKPYVPSATTAQPQEAL